MKMKSIIKVTIAMVAATLLSGCLVLPLKQVDEDRSLYWCPPLLNCASTEASTFVHKIDSFELTMEYDQAWPIIKDSVRKLDRTNIQVEYHGYLYAKSHSSTMKFVDYFEVLYVSETKSLNVRSSSLLGIWDMGVNRSRTESLRIMLIKGGAIK
ncbi:MAG: hypothetical protein ACJAYK_001200 [Crocinitomicaceae bacterium]|jgi:uncharacterized protein (DUF1499 family)